MATQNKMQRLMKAAKAEVTSFGASGILALAGVGLEHGGALLKLAGASHPVLGAVGETAEASGKMIQTVAVPAAGATFIALVTKFGKVWRDLTENKAVKKAPARSAVNRSGQKLSLDACFGGDMAGCEA
jgi:hypothetical protein